MGKRIAAVAVKLLAGMIPAITWDYDAPQSTSGRYLGCWISQEFDFGITDEKRRHVGGIARIEKVQPGCHGPDGFEPSPVPPVFRLSTRALRDGQAYGASPRETAFAALEAAQAAAVKALTAQRARYAKKYGEEAPAAPAKREEIAESTVAKLDEQAGRAVHKLAVQIPDGAFHGFVPAETMEWLYGHVATLASELVKEALSLPVPQITLSVDKNRKNQLGHYKIGRDGLGLRWRISMNILHLGAPKADVIRVLLHEILHAVQHESGTPGKVANYHNAEFQGWCERLGIPTDSQGHDKGTTPDGLYDQYAKRHKLDGVAKLLPPKALPKPGGSKLKKWCCQGCAEPVNVRVAIADFDATCNACGTAFVYADKE